jgi:hypothetical protein
MEILYTCGHTIKLFKTNSIDLSLDITGNSKSHEEDVTIKASITMIGSTGGNNDIRFVEKNIFCFNRRATNMAIGHIEEALKMFTNGKPKGYTAENDNAISLFNIWLKRSNEKERVLVLEILFEDLGESLKKFFGWNDNRESEDVYYGFDHMPTEHFKF